MERRSGLYTSFVIIATFLCVPPALASAFGGQPQPQVLLVTQPRPLYYLTKDRPVDVTCEAYGATSIAFLCLGSPVPAGQLATFRSFDQQQGSSKVSSSLKVGWAEVQGALEAGVQEYWCQCTAQNEDRFLSVTSRRAVVALAFLEKHFQESPANQIEAPGAQTVLTCVPPVGNPVPQVTWRKDGHKVKVDEDDNLVVGADNSLTILRTRPEDAGTYHCVARNLAGRRVSSLAMVVVEGKEGMDVEDELVAEQPTAVVHKDTPRHRAPREVRKPVFSEQPLQEVYITPNQPVKIACAVDGATRMTVRCNNQRIEPERLVSQSDRQSQYIRKELTLTYPEVENYLNTYTDSLYKCECVAWYTDPSLPRNWGSVISEKGTIYLAHLAEEFEAEPEDATVQVGTAASLTCQPPDGLPFPTVTWIFEQQRIEPEVDRRYTVSEDGTLTINRVNHGDEGWYYCVAKNTMGIRQSDIATLTVSDEPVAEVLEPSPSPTTGYMPTFPAEVPDTPVFIRDLDPVYYLDEKNQSKLVCSVVSADSLTYRCMQDRLNENEQVIDMQTDRASGKRLLTASTVVTKQKLDSVQEGDFSCLCVAWYLQNSAWHHNFSSTAVIRPAYIGSRFLYEPQGGMFYSGDPAEFACQPPDGGPMPVVTWTKDGETLHPDTDDNFVLLPDGGLIVDSVKPEDAGEYVCVATNAAGVRKSRPAVLEVYSPDTTTTTDRPDTRGPTDGPRYTTSTTDMDEGMFTTTTVHPDDFQLSTSKSGRIIPFFTIEAVDVAYVINQEGSMLTCGAVEAANLFFICNGERVAAERETGIFKAVDPDTGYKFLEKSVVIRYSDLEAFQGSGDFTCHCRAYYLDEGLEEDKWQFVAATDTIVKLAYMDQQFVEEPVQQFAELGVSTELICRPPMGEPKPTVRWLKNGFLLRENNNVRVTPEGSLIFGQVTQDDSGNYTCVAENILGSSNSNTVPLVVVDQEVTTEDSVGEPEGEAEGTTEPTGEGESEESWEGVPRFIALPEENYYIIRSRPVIITCQAIGSEQINFNCNGESIPQSRVQYQDLEVEGFDEVMTASVEISREEVENYNNRYGGNDFYCQCYARYTDPTSVDPQYVVSDKGYVQVAYLKKMFQQEPSDITVNEGEYVTLSCQAPEGHPKPEVYWTMDGKRIDRDMSDAGDSLIIESAGAADAGIYVCVATNVANTRRSGSSSVRVMVGDMLVTGMPVTDGVEPEGEPGTTTPDYDVSWTTGQMTPEQHCMTLIQSCTAIMPRELSGPDSPGCRNAQRYKECVTKFLEECQGVLDKESMDAADATRKVVEKGCGGSRVCQELLDCQSEYSNQQVPNADAETTPMEILCEGIHSFLRCAESAAETCGIPQDNPDTSLTDLAVWFEDYCERVVDQDWAKQCSSFSQCDLPIEQTTILGNIVQASLWCPYVEDTMQCTRQAVSDCGVGDVEEDLNSLDTLAQMTCNPSAEGEDRKDHLQEGKAEEADPEEGGAHGESTDSDKGGHASCVQASMLLTMLLSAVWLLVTWR